MKTSVEARPNEDGLAGLLAEHFGLAVRDVVGVDGGADRAAATFRLTDRSGRRFAVKRTAGGSPAGVALPAALADALPGAAPRPLSTDGGELWADVDGTRLSVTEWVDGDDGVTAPMGPDTWRAYGRLLAGLHRLPVDGPLERWLPREEFDPSRWVGLFDRVDAALSGVDASGAADDPGAQLARLWSRRRSDLIEARRRAMRLAVTLARRADRLDFVPCHADPHLANVIVTSPTTVTLIDFDDAVLAPAERDLMFVLGGGVLADTPATAAQQRWFRDGYGTHASDPDLLTYYRCLRTLEDVAEPAAATLDPNCPPAERTTNLGYVTDVLSPAGLLDQALRPGSTAAQARSRRRG